MVDALPSDRADEPFDIGVLPGRARRCRSISDAERPKAPGDDLPIGAISIANPVLRSLLPAARLRQLSRNPFRGRVCGCGRPQDPATVMLQDENAEEQAKRNGWDHEKIHRGDAVGMIAQEGLPALRRRSPPPRHILRHARLPDIDAELEELAMDPRRAPEWVGQAHLADQPTYLQRDLWASAAGSRLPAPVGSEPRTMPTDHRIGLHDRQRLANVGEQPVEAHEYQAIKAVEGKPSPCGPPQNVDLLAQDEVLCRNRRSRSEQPDKPRPDQSAKVLHHMAVSPTLLPLSTSRLRLPTKSSSVITWIVFAVGTGAASCRRATLHATWQVDYDAGATAGSALDTALAAMLLDDLPHRGEAQSCAGSLGAKQRLEQLGKVLTWSLDPRSPVDEAP